jgi:hypothetical protein
MHLQCISIAPTVSGMVHDVQVVIRVPKSLAAEAERLLKLMGKSPNYRAESLSKTAVYRKALDRGLQALREELERANGTK